MRSRFLAEAKGKPKAHYQPATLGEVMRDVGTQNFDFDELWTDARMEEVLVYLRGSTALHLPKELRKYIPASVPCAHPSVA